MQRPSGKPTRRGDASETESLSSLDYEGGAPSADFVHASFQGGSGMRGATMAGGGDSGFLTTTGNNVVGPTSVRPEVRFSLLFTLFMGGFVQLFGFNCQLAYSVFLGREVLVSNGEKNREWAALALFPYAGLAVAGALLYLTTVSLRARKGLELAQAATTTPGRSSANEDSDAAEQSSMLQPRTSASEGERRVETAILSGCSFHLRFFLALSLMGLSFVPVMTLAVHYRSLTCAILSMALNGLAQAWLTGCLVGLCAALENPKTMVAYNLGNAAAAWPTAILGIVFVVQKQFQPSVVYCQVVFGLCAFSCLAYYFAYFSVLRPYAQSTDEIAVALRQVEENQLEFFPGARNGESADGFPLARDGSFSTGTAAAQKLPAQRSSGEEPASRSQEKEQQIKKAAVAVGSGAGDLAHIGSAPGKNNIQRTFCELVCASWQIITAMLLHFLFTFIVFPGVERAVAAAREREANGRAAVADAIGYLHRVRHLRAVHAAVGAAAGPLPAARRGGAGGAAAARVLPLSLLPGGARMAHRHHDLLRVDAGAPDHEHLHPQRRARDQLPGGGAAGPDGLRSACHGAAGGIVDAVRDLDGTAPSRRRGASNAEYGGG
eukprot:CAMPEP_0178989990 /NCGR_PEP_ID=MMETSP0795-20121207/4682_1 /TAXON_ID=88552 /ORGANISM="Amoebophrya sp., Strain Ameob2" /LENGTH=605 /DNA_ID=CAMNT_0020681455 /DNA_START=140 /DNA_END=1956 /DNA_ORIENTATION=+